MHGRLFPKRNHFTYGIYYLALPLDQLNKTNIAYNKPALLSFHDKDHGACDGSNLTEWARALLAQHNIDKADGRITLVCMPRILGYVFNPVSFWLCHDKSGNIRAILCEVHNTFGEKHTYICSNSDQSVITGEQTIKGKKVFHVSPFLKREGHYDFNFNIRNSRLDISINFFSENNKKQLVTRLYGQLSDLNKNNLRKAFWSYPLVTFKAITLIHWQALKIISKGIKYVSKPLQKKERSSKAIN